VLEESALQAKNPDRRGSSLPQWFESRVSVRKDEAKRCQRNVQAGN